MPIGGVHDTTKRWAYYKFSAGELPDEYFHPTVPVDKWLSAKSTEKGEAVLTFADERGFENGSLAVLRPVAKDVELERIFGIALYMIGNVLPFVLPGMIVSAISRQS